MKHRPAAPHRQWLWAVGIVGRCGAEFGVQAQRAGSQALSPAWCSGVASPAGTDQHRKVLHRLAEMRDNVFAELRPPSISPNRSGVRASCRCAFRTTGPTDRTQMQTSRKSGASIRQHRYPREVRRSSAGTALHEWAVQGQRLAECRNVTARNRWTSQNVAARLGAHQRFLFPGEDLHRLPLKLLPTIYRTCARPGLAIAGQGARVDRSHRRPQTDFDLDQMPRRGSLGSSERGGSHAVLFQHTRPPSHSGRGRPRLCSGFRSRDLCKISGRGPALPRDRRQTSVGGSSDR